MRIRNCVTKWVVGLALALALSLVDGGVRGEGDAVGKPPTHPDHKAEFLKLCDLACAELNKDITPFEEKHRTVVEPDTHHVPFFEDSYTVRALAVAYDITGKKEYLDACRHWADRVVALQEKMTPKGAYYLNYGGTARQPGATSGDWWVADSGSVAMGILATAARATDKTEKDRYLNSVKSFAKLVIDNYVRKDGGITDGIWSTYMAGLPYLMYVFARELPENVGLDQAADEELHFVHGLLFENGDPPLSLVETWELMSWAMMSYAEKLSPGSLFRSSER